MTTTTPAVNTPATRTRTRPSLWARKREERLSVLILHVYELERDAMHRGDHARVAVHATRLTALLDVYDRHVLTHLCVWIDS